ncbi:hypothetical protein [Vibrio phage vB_VmeM-Yong XC32]|nr:hypothetical protein [Vibrio phage vB_VmeM-Yong XC31]QAX96368.1 hypothetical protein [Vibrio phage vB_VmeM-Yong XC32]QAX96686.1 hypothetical protein [Vibrio phage vB_VmeM-Yong MS31]QAX97004.1 hypothetical protein [Vibrio phage vB_VmeM-Yong MS32]
MPKSNHDKVNPTPYADYIYNKDVAYYHRMIELVKRQHYSEELQDKILKGLILHMTTGKPLQVRMRNMVDYKTPVNRKTLNQMANGAPTYVAWTLFNRHLKLAGYRGTMMHVKNNNHQEIEKEMRRFFSTGRTVCPHPYYSYIGTSPNREANDNQKKFFKVLEEKGLIKRK